MKIDNKTLRNVFLGVAGCIFLYWMLHETERVRGFLNIVNNIFSPFVVGAALAFILNVPMRGIEKLLKGIKKQGLRRALAIILTLVAVVIVITGVFQLLIPQLMATVMTLVEKLPGFFNRVYAMATEFLNEHPDLKQWVRDYTDLENLDLAKLIENVIAVVGNSVTVVFNGAVSAVGSVSGAVVDAVIGFVFALYALARKEILARQGRRILYSFLPEHFCDECIRILRLTNSTFSNFISGQCLEAVILGCLFAVAMLIFRMPYVALVSVIIAVTALVPLVGAFIGCVLGAFFILVDNPLMAVWFVVMFLVLQQIENNLIYPRVVGTSIGLPGMWVLVAVAVGGEVMGVGGMFLMIPIASVLYTLAREVTTKRLAAREIPAEKLQDQPPELKSKFREKREKKKEQKLLKQMKELAEKHSRANHKEEK